MSGFARREDTRPAAGLRVALLAGTLAQGGAEKQLLYMAQALQGSGAHVRVFSLTEGEFFEAGLAACGLAPTHVGRFHHPLLRLATLRRQLRAFRPHILQSGHFFANLYVALIGPTLRTLSIGSIRNDTHYEMASNGRWGRWLLKTPPALFANSHMARNNAAALGLDPSRIQIIPNVIDVQQFDELAAIDGHLDSHPTALMACRLVEAKRVDRFLLALALARRRAPRLSGVIVGDGPERQALERMAREYGLYPDGVRFLGRRDDVPALLRASTMVVSTSDHEGFPNVIIEAMAARRPVVATPAGDVARIVADGRTGFLVDFEDRHALTARIAELATSPELCRTLGEAGRTVAQERYSVDRLGGVLLDAYRTIAGRQSNQRLLRALNGSPALRPEPA